MGIPLPNIGRQTYQIRTKTCPNPATRPSCRRTCGRNRPFLMPHYKAGSAPCAIAIIIVNTRSSNLRSQPSPEYLPVQFLPVYYQPASLRSSGADMWPQGARHLLQPQVCDPVFILGLFDSRAWQRIDSSHSACNCRASAFAFGLHDLAPSCLANVCPQSDGLEILNGRSY
jgi:hypothetical protein